MSSSVNFASFSKKLKLTALHEKQQILDIFFLSFKKVNQFLEIILPFFVGKIHPRLDNMQPGFYLLNLYCAT
jgi:hypothetical protein